MSHGTLVDNAYRAAAPNWHILRPADVSAGSLPCHVDAIDVTESVEGLAALEAEWTALHDRAGRPHHVFQTHAFAMTWLETLAGSGECLSERGAGTSPRLAIVTVRRDNRLVLVLPLVRKHWLGFTELCWLGEPIQQYGDALVEDLPDAAALIRAALAHVTRVIEPDFFHLRNVRADATIAPVLAALGTIETRREEAPYVRLGPYEGQGSFEDLQNGKARKNRRRLMRRLEEHGAVRFVVASGAESSDLVAVALRQKLAWLRHRGIFSRGLGNGHLARFLTRAASQDGAATGLRAFALTLENEPVAVALGFAGTRRLTLHLISYAIAHEKSGVGVLNLEAILRHAETAGLEAVDLLAPSADYKSDWTKSAVSVTDHVLSNRALARACAAGFEVLAVPRARVLYAALPLWLRRRLCR